MNVRFRVLGPLEVEVDGHVRAVPAGRCRALLAVLLLRPNEIVPFDELTRTVGGTLHALHQTMSRLRVALGDANCVKTLDAGYVAETDNVDLLEFRALRDQGRHAEALDLWRGNVLPDIDLPSVRHEAALLEEERVAAERRISVPRGLPAPPAHFTGRRAQLAALDQDGITVITGTAGVGKTALALQWAHEHTDRFPAGQLHVNLRGFDPSAEPTTPEQALRGFLSALKVPADQIPPDRAEQTALFRKLVRGKKMLVLLDNARDTDQIRPLLPDDSCRTLITSRHHLDAEHTITLGTLDADEAAQLVARRIGRAPDELKEIVTWCAGLPLALSIVAARAAADPHLPLPALAEELADQHSTLDALDTGDPTTSVRSVFSWSYQRLTEPARRLFRLLGAHPGPDISTEAAASLTGGTPPLDELVRHNLVQRDQRHRFSLHDLVRAYARDLGDPVENHAALVRVGDHYLQTAHQATLLLRGDGRSLNLAPPRAGVTPEKLADYDEARAWYETEFPVLRAVLGFGFDRVTWQLTWSIFTYMDFVGRQREYVPLGHNAMEAAQRLGDQEAAARMSHMMGFTLKELNEWEAAEPYFRAALQAHLALGDLNGAARVHSSIAAVLEHRGQYRAAIDEAMKAHSLLLESGDEQGAMGIIAQTGWFHGLLGEHETAIERCREAAAHLADIGDRIGVANALDSIAYNLNALGDHAGAVSNYEDALTIWREMDDGTEIAVTLVHLGDAEHARGHHDNARKAWQEALELYERSGHPNAAQPRERLTEWEAGPSSG